MKRKEKSQLVENKLLQTCHIFGIELSTTFEINLEINIEVVWTTLGRQYVPD